MLRKKVIIILMFGLLLTACGPTATPQPATVSAGPVATKASTAAPTPQAMALTDGLGRQVTLPGPAQRVVSLAPSNTEILFAIGAGGQVVGRDEFSDYPEEAKSLPTVGGSMGQYNQEAIVALKPDLVLAAGINSPELVKSLEDLGLTVYYLTNPTTLEEMYTNLETVGTLMGHSSDAAALSASLQERVAAVDARLASIGDRPTVFYEIDATDPAKPYTYGPGTFGDLLIQRAGGTNIGAKLQDAYPQMSFEQLVVDDPEVIVLGDSNFGVTVDSVKARPGWEKLKAVQQDTVYPFDDDLVSRPGPRLVDGLESLAKLLHPQLFQ